MGHKKEECVKVYRKMNEEMEESNAEVANAPIPQPIPLEEKEEEGQGPWILVGNKKKRDFRRRNKG